MIFHIRDRSFYFGEMSFHRQEYQSRVSVRGRTRRPSSIRLSCKPMVGFLLTGKRMTRVKDRDRVPTKREQKRADSWVVPEV